MGDGRIVYISIEKPKIKCPGDPDYLFSVGRPDDVNDVMGAGGLEVKVRGSFAPYRGGCQLQGFYMNQPVFGMHFGWVETYCATISPAGNAALGARPVRGASASLCGSGTFTIAQ
jgi:hypothetical protein